MKMIAKAVVAAAFALPASGALAEETCKDKIAAVSDQLPDLTEVTTEEAMERTGLTEEQIEAVLASLDAARIALESSDEEGCETMVQAAEDVLARGKETGTDG